MEHKLNQQWNKGVGEIKELTMTQAEKERMFLNILSSHAKKPQASPYLFHWSYRMTVVVLPLLAVVVLSSGVVFASGRSLPGDRLYPLKVNVVEKVQGALIFSPERAAEYESDLANGRLREAEALAKMGSLDQLREEKINILLGQHTQALKKNLGELHKKNSAKEKEIATRFGDDMYTHAEVLELLEIEVKGKSEDKIEKRMERSKLPERARENGAIIRGVLDVEVD